MSLLKQLLATTSTVRGVEEIVDCKLINLMGAAPVIVGDVPRKRVRAVIEITGDDGKPVQKDAYMFDEAVVGAPTMIPAGGLVARATLRESDGLDAKGQAVKYVNVVHLGVQTPA